MMAINRYRLKSLAKTNKKAERTERLLGNLGFAVLNLHNSTTFLLSKISKYTSMPK
jgi:Mg2+/Co2+ transporter CorB